MYAFVGYCLSYLFDEFTNKKLVNTYSVYMFVRKNRLYIMDAKLTLKLDKYVVDRAKEYATSQKRSLSRLIESYLKSLIENDKMENKNDIEISPFVKSLRTGVKIPANINYKEAYSDYLSEKYK
jgi:uncharacterized protein YpmS